MRIVQLVTAEGRVVHTFVTEEQFQLEVFNSMLEGHGAALVEGLGLQSTPIGKVAAKYIEQAAAATARAQLEAELAADAADDVVADHLGVPRGAYALQPKVPVLSPAQLEAAELARVAAAAAPPRVPSGHRDPRETALGSGSAAPMPHRNSGPVAEAPPADWLIRPGQADGLGKSTVLQVHGGAVMRAPGWTPRQHETEDVERAPGAFQPLDDE